MEAVSPDPSLEKFDWAGSERRWWQEEGKSDRQKEGSENSATFIKFKNQTTESYIITSIKDFHWMKKSVNID